MTELAYWTELLPPSTNQLYANVAGKGRVKSERYIQWQNAAGWDFQRGHISGPFTAEIIICSSRRNKRRDLDNFAKPILDLLVKHGVVDDDSLCQELHMAWGEAASGMRVTVKPYGN